LEIKVSNTVVSTIDRSLGCGLSTSKHMTIALLWELVKLIKAVIWTTRCEFMIALEQRVNITMQDKRGNIRNNSCSNTGERFNCVPTEFLDDVSLEESLTNTNTRTTTAITRKDRQIAALPSVWTQVKATYSKMSDFHGVSNQRGVSIGMCSGSDWFNFISLIWLIFRIMISFNGYFMLDYDYNFVSSFTLFLFYL